jgi:hypothetical protein
MARDYNENRANPDTIPARCASPDYRWIKILHPQCTNRFLFSPKRYEPDSGFEPPFVLAELNLKNHYQVLNTFFGESFDPLIKHGILPDNVRTMCSHQIEPLAASKIRYLAYA